MKHISVRTHRYNASDAGRQERILYNHRRYDHIRRCLFSLLLALALLTSLLPTLAHPSIRSLSVAHAQEPCGGKIAFVRDGSLWIMNSDGSEQRELTHGVQFRPSWSPDGKEIAFSAYPQWRIHIINLQTGQLRELAGRPGCWACDPSWSPDGLSIAYYFQCGNTSNDPAGAAVMDTTDGSNSRDLFMRASFPIWSPDGSKIAAHRGPLVPGGEPAGGLYICDRDGSNCKRLTDRIGAYPTWSPDGQFIAQDLEDSFIWLFPVDGDPPRRLVKGFYPSWASDSTRIAFTDYTDGPKIALINVDGTEYQQLTEGGYAAWQPCPRSSIAQTLEEKRDNIAFLTNPTFGVIGLPTIRGPGYDESKANDLLDEIREQYEQGTLDFELVSGLRRLKLQEDVISTAYNNYVVTVDDLNDTTISAFGLVLDIMDAAKRVTQPLGEIGAKILQAIVEKLSDWINDWIQASSGVSPQWKTYATIMLDHMKGMSSPRASAAGGLRLPADEHLVEDFVAETQPIIDQAVSNARDPNMYAGSDDQEVQREIEARLEKFENDTNRRHRFLESVKEILDDCERAVLPMLATGKPGELFIIVSIVITRFTELDIQIEMTAKNVSDTKALLVDSQALLFPHTQPVSLGSAANLSILSKLQLAMASTTDINYVQLSTPNVEPGSISLQIQHLQTARGEYEEVLHKVLYAVEQGDKDSLTALLPELIATEREVSAQLKILRASLLATGPSHDSAQLFANSSAYNLQAVALYLALAGNLEKPGDADAQQRTVAQADTVLQNLETYQQTIEAGLRGAAPAATAMPVVLIASYSVPDEIISGQPFELTAKVVNAGAESVSDVSVRVVGGEIVSAKQTVALGEIAGTEEKVATFQLEAVGSGTEILTLNVLEGDDVLSTQLVCASVVEKPVGDMLTPSAVEEPVGGALTPSVVEEPVGDVLTPSAVEEPVGGALAPKESRPQKLPIPCGGLGIISVVVFLLVWLQLVRPTI